MKLCLPPHLAGRAALRPRDLVEAFGVSKQAVRRLVKEGVLDGVRLDGFVLISRESVEKWLQTARDAR